MNRARILQENLEDQRQANNLLYTLFETMKVNKFKENRAYAKDKG